MGIINNAKPQGMGFLRYTPEDMTVKEARELLVHQGYFDYVKGRVMKVNLMKDKLDTTLYNRDNGYKSAERVLEALVK